MIDSIDNAADRLLAGFAPKATAQAKSAYCWKTTIPCAFCGCYGSKAWYRTEFHCDSGGHECGSECDYSTVC